jgi:penicillin-binding protein 2
VTPIQLVRALSGIASAGHLVRPHVVDTGQLPAQFRQAMVDTFHGTGEQQVELSSDTWMTVTDGMAAATTPGLYHTAEGAHLEGIDFAGKTGTAQVVGGGDTHNKGGAKTPNAWFVGMAPRRNPEIAVVVLQEHGDWGSGSAKLAAQVITAYVNKKRKQDGNLMLQADKKPAPVEMGAVWSTPDAGSVASKHSVSVASEGRGMLGGHFVIAADAVSPQGYAPMFPDRKPDGRRTKVPTIDAILAETGLALPAKSRTVSAGGGR